MLVSESGEEFETKTGQAGQFFTLPVTPGKYRLTATHTSFSISDPVDIELGNDLTLSGLPVITGYQISGRIEENSQAVQGVTFILSKDGIDISKIDSDVRGEFVFNQIKAGTYQITPVYQTDISRFTVSPASQSITVSTDNFDLSSPFIVTGLSVSGFVQVKSFL